MERPYISGTLNSNGVKKIRSTNLSVGTMRWSKTEKVDFNEKDHFYT